LCAKALESVPIAPERRWEGRDLDDLAILENAGLAKGQV
jgi:hypothetical protein